MCLPKNLLKCNLSPTPFQILMSGQICLVTFFYLFYIILVPLPTCGACNELQIFILFYFPGKNLDRSFIWWYNCFIIRLRCYQYMTITTLSIILSYSFVAFMHSLFIYYIISSLPLQRQICIAFFCVSWLMLFIQMLWDEMRVIQFQVIFAMLSFWLLQILFLQCFQTVFSFLRLMIPKGFKW